MKYNDFIEILPNEITKKLMAGYSSTKILTNKNNLDNNILINKNYLANSHINKKIIKILTNYEIIINSLKKYNYVNSNTIDLITADYNKIKNYYNIKNSKTNIFLFSKTNIIRKIINIQKEFINLIKSNSSFIIYLQNLFILLECLIVV